MIKVLKENNHIADMRPQKGQSLFSYDIAKKKVLKMEEIEELEMVKGFLYVLAINKKNAAKKFIKLLTR